MLVATNRINGTYHGAGGAIYKVLATPARTGNLHFAFEATEPPGGGPPLHIHTRHEEFFFVLEGEISFWLDGQVITRSVGGTAFVPRGVPHCPPRFKDDGAFGSWLVRILIDEALAIRDHCAAVAMTVLI